MKRFVSLTILFALLLSNFACGTQSDVQNGTDETTSDSAETTTAAVEEEESDDLPDVTFGGRTFTTLVYANVESHYAADEENGEVINDAVYKRNTAVEERFDVELKTVADTHLNVASLLTNTVMAGDDAYQLVANHVVVFGGTAQSDVLMNWYDVPYIDFSKSWWADSTVEDLTYNGVALLAIGDYALSALSDTYCYFYDKKAADDYHFEDLYTVVNEGRWTLDYVMDLCKDVYSDLNGNGQRDGEDYYGLTSTVLSPINTYLWSSGNKILTKQSDGSFDFTYNNEHTVDIIEKLNKMFYETDGITVSRPQYPDTSPEKHYMTALAFNDNLTAMIPGLLSFSIDHFRDRKSDYGILPYPKYDEAQTEYRTSVDGGHVALGIPKSVKDTEFVGIITEALNAETRKTVYPAYYEIALKVKYTRDDESVKMLDMIVDSRVFDFGYVYDNWKGVSFMFQSLIADNSSDFASYYAKNGSTAEAYYEGIFEYFDDIANS